MFFNEGYGAALQVRIIVKDDHFEDQGIHTQTMPTIAPNRTYNHWLDILPKAAGDEVPIRLILEYVDKQDNEHQLQRRVYLTVTDDRLVAGKDYALSDSQSFAKLEAPDG